MDIQSFNYKSASQNCHQTIETLNDYYEAFILKYIIVYIIKNLHAHPRLNNRTSILQKLCENGLVRKMVITIGKMCIACNYAKNFNNGCLGLRERRHSSTPACIIFHLRREKKCQLLSPVRDVSLQLMRGLSKSYCPVFSSSVEFVKKFLQLFCI